MQRKGRERRRTNKRGNVTLTKKEVPVAELSIGSLAINTTICDSVSPERTTDTFTVFSFSPTSYDSCEKLTVATENKI